MRRAISWAGAGLLCLTPMAAAAVEGAAGAEAEQVALHTTAATLTQSLVSAAMLQPASATMDDYLRVFVAEIAASGANQPTIFSAIDAAVGTAGLPRPAIAALESLRKRVRPVRDYTGGTATQRTTIFSPTVSTSGGSDYLR